MVPKGPRTTHHTPGICCIFCAGQLTVCYPDSGILNRQLKRQKSYRTMACPQGSTFTHISLTTHRASTSTALCAAHTADSMMCRQWPLPPALQRHLQKNSHFDFASLMYGPCYCFAFLCIIPVYNLSKHNLLHHSMVFRIQNPPEVTHQTPGIFFNCFMCSSYSTAQMVPVTQLLLSCWASGQDSIIRKPPRLTHNLRLNLAGIIHSVVTPSGYSTCSILVTTAV